MLWWLEDSCLMVQWEGLNTAPIQMASLYTQRDVLFCPPLPFCRTHQAQLFLSAFYEDPDSFRAKIPHLGTVNSWFVIVLDYHLIYHSICLPLWNVTHSGNRSSKTFKPKKNIPEGSHQYELLKHAEATLGSGNLRMAVMLPEGEDLNEWVAVNSKHQFYLLFTHSLI